MFLSELKLDAIEPGSAIDTGAEEERFRALGQQAAAEVLAKRWESGNAEYVGDCPECGRQMKNLGMRPKEVRTLCGPMRLLRRIGYCEHCEKTVSVLDERLGIKESGITPGLQRVICRTALEMAYEPTEALLKDVLGFKPCSAREIERIACKHGKEIEKVSDTIYTRPPQTKKVYSLSIDGTMIPGLADPEKHRIIWHEIKLATVTDVRDFEMPFYVASTENAEGFGSRLCKNLQAMSITPDTMTQVIADGAPWIWNQVDLHFPGVQQLLDFYHASEHLHKTAVAIWPKEKEKADAWWKERCDQLKTGKLDDFFASLKLIAKCYANSISDDAGPERLLKYFEANRNRLGYAEALKNNWPIGSGAVESAGRHLVQQRLKRSGMRWSLPGAQAILNLRTCHRSGFFESYWEALAA